MFLKGHKIICGINGEWFYKDTGEPTIGTNRDCGYCKKSNRLDGHDACIGKLKGVINACCGHGQENEAYIQFSDKSILQDKAALMIIKNKVKS